MREIFVSKVGVLVRRKDHILPFEQAAFPPSWRPIYQPLRHLINGDSPGRAVNEGRPSSGKQSHATTPREIEIYRYIDK